MNNKMIIGAVLIIVAIGIWYATSSTPAVAPAPEAQNSAAETMPEVLVAYTEGGFSPASVTVRQGETVTWVNQSSRDMWVASAMHPSHAVYSGTSLSQHCPDTENTAFDQCTAGTSGSSYSFTFDNAGTWKYHDHVNAGNFGTIIVQ